MAWTKIVPGTDDTPWKVLEPDTVPAAAGDIGITDAGGLYDAENVEDALQEVKIQVDAVEGGGYDLGPVTSLPDPALVTRGTKATLLAGNADRDAETYDEDTEWSVLYGPDTANHWRRKSYAA